MIETTALQVITLFSTFLWRPLRHYDVKPPNWTFHGERGHTTTNFPSSFWSWIKSWRIQPQEKSPAFDILSGSKQTRLSLKEPKFIFLPTFSQLPSSSSLLKVPSFAWYVSGNCWLRFNGVCSKLVKWTWSEPSIVVCRIRNTCRRVPVELISFVCKWCSAMWLLTSPFLVARLCSVSRVVNWQSPHAIDLVRCWSVCV